MQASAVVCATALLLRCLQFVGHVQLVESNDVFGIWQLFRRSFMRALTNTGFQFVGHVPIECVPFRYAGEAMCVICPFRM